MQGDVTFCGHFLQQQGTALIQKLTGWSPCHQEGDISEEAEWKLVLFSRDRCLSLILVSKDSAKKKSKEKGEWAVKCSFLLLPIAENQHTKYQLLL